MNIDKTNPTIKSNYFRIPNKVETSTTLQKIAKVVAIALTVIATLGTAGVYILVNRIVYHYIDKRTEERANADAKVAEENNDSVVVEENNDSVVVEENNDSVVQEQTVPQNIVRVATVVAVAVAAFAILAFNQQEAITIVPNAVANM